MVIVQVRCQLFKLLGMDGCVPLGTLCNTLLWCVSERADLVGMCWHWQTNTSVASQLAPEVGEEESHCVCRAKGPVDGSDDVSPIVDGSKLLL